MTGMGQDSQIFGYATFTGAFPLLQRVDQFAVAQIMQSRRRGSILGNDPHLSRFRIAAGCVKPQHAQR